MTPTIPPEVRTQAREVWLQRCAYAHALRNERGGELPNPPHAYASASYPWPTFTAPSAPPTRLPIDGMPHHAVTWAEPCGLHECVVLEERTPRSTRQWPIDSMTAPEAMRAAAALLLATANGGTPITYRVETTDGETFTAIPVEGDK